MSFKDDATAFLLQKGTLTEEGGWVWGWRAGTGDIRDKYDGLHTDDCQWVPTSTSTMVEQVYTEFEGTDVDSQQKTLLSLTHVDCMCGAIRDRTIGIEGGTMELLRELLGIKREYH